MFTEGPYKSIEDIKRKHHTRGHHFFDYGALRFFDSRIEQDVYGMRYFLTSERFHGPDNYHAPRKWTIRRVENDGAINTVGEFNKIASYEDARSIVTNLIALQNTGLTETEAILQLMRDLLTPYEIECIEKRIAREKQQASK